MWFNLLSLPDVEGAEQLYGWAENGQAKGPRSAY